MCGIAGCSLGSLDSGEAHNIAQSFMKVLHHRGPDSNGFWKDDGNVLLTHTRLSIIDLSPTGHQPMASYSGRYVISYNGEIYNFSELKKILEAMGVPFAGTSDTEVILALFEVYGIHSALTMMSGMFAFAVYDREQEALTIARDRMGEKPLFYGWVNGQFAFASELKAFKFLSNKLSINKDCVADFLKFGYIPTPLSIYDNIYKLTPGTSFTVCKSDNYGASDSDFSPYPNKVSGPKAFWDLKELSKNSISIESPSLALDMLEECLSKAIHKQLVADVPIGCFLSGGVDSSLVTAIAQELTVAPVKTFTVGFEEVQFNEAGFARDIASYLGTEHHEVYVKSRDILNFVDRLPAVYDEPFGDPSQLPSMLVSEVAKRDVSVCLSGDGGDELFGGYNRYIMARTAISRTKNVPVVVRKVIGNLLLRINPIMIDRLQKCLKSLPGIKRHRQVNLGLKLQKLGFVLQASSYEEIYLFLLKLDGLEERGPKTLLEERISEFFSSFDDFISTAMLVDQLNYLVDDNLTKVDRSSMAASLETRLPLLDRNVVELSWRIPESIKIKDGITKWPLKKLLYNRVPRELIDRPKMGFSVPVSEFLRSELKQWSFDILSHPLVSGYLDTSRYLYIWDQHQRRKGDYGLALWPALIFSQWLISS
tara:strand:+ start:19722 stop:21674 length:1953 start_codon:yes stop_codon:yes gene_type:complete